MNRWVEMNWWMSGNGQIEWLHWLKLGEAALRKCTEEPSEDWLWWMEHSSQFDLDGLEAVESLQAWLGGFPKGHWLFEWLPLNSFCFFLFLGFYTDSRPETHWHLKLTLGCFPFQVPLLFFLGCSCSSFHFWGKPLPSFLGTGFPLQYFPLFLFPWTPQVASKFAWKSRFILSREKCRGMIGFWMGVLDFPTSPSSPSFVIIVVFPLNLSWKLISKFLFLMSFDFKLPLIRPKRRRKGSFLRLTKFQYYTGGLEVAGGVISPLVSFVNEPAVAGEAN